MQRRPTLAVVAERAGVSVASASRALNGLPASVATADRVRAVARELGYAPNAMARSLKASRTEQLVFAVADVGNPVYVAMMRSIEQVVRAGGYRLVLSSTGSDPQQDIGVLRSLAHGYADGLVLSPVRLTADLVEEIRVTPAPVVVVGSLPRDVERDSVQADSPRGVRLALDHLYATGRRRIAFVNGPVDTVPGSSRARGFRLAAARLGLAAEPALRVEAADFTVAAGREVAAELMDRCSPDAVLAANDLLAVGVLHELDARGVAVPDEVGVVGMDDTDLAGLVRPGLTSVDLGSAERGRIAAGLLLERIAAPDRPVQRIRVGAHLSVRGSSGPAAAGAR